MDFDPHEWTSIGRLNITPPRSGDALRWQVSVTYRSDRGPQTCKFDLETLADLNQAFIDGAADERAKIVAWLRMETWGHCRWVYRSRGASEMIKITQDDVDAAQEMWMLSINYRSRPTMEEVCRKHREKAYLEERAKIVAWLRANPRGMIEYEEMYAASIEEGEHLK